MVLFTGLRSVLDRCVTGLIHEFRPVVLSKIILLQFIYLIFKINPVKSSRVQI